MKTATLLIALALACAAPAAAQTANRPATPQPQRTISITADSARDWVPSDALQTAAEQAAARYFAARDGGKFAEAYAMLTEANRALQTPADFQTDSEALQASTGALTARTLTQTTWTKDSARAPAPGIYAAIDFTSRYAKADRECGYIILYQPPTGGAFQVMREERIVLDNETAATITREQSALEVATLWRQLSAHCPNYRAPSP